MGKGNNFVLGIGNGNVTFVGVGFCVSVRSDQNETEERDLTETYTD
jgi:hypothetical protein